MKTSDSGRPWERVMRQDMKEQVLEYAVQGFRKLDSASGKSLEECQNEISGAWDEAVAYLDSDPKAILRQRLISTLSEYGQRRDDAEPQPHELPLDGETERQLALERDEAARECSTKLRQAVDDFLQERISVDPGAWSRLEEKGPRE